MTPVKRCIDCPALSHQSRCPACARAHEAQRSARRGGRNNAMAWRLAVLGGRGSQNFRPSQGPRIRLRWNPLCTQLEFSAN